MYSFWEKHIFALGDLWPLFWSLNGKISLDNTPSQIQHIKIHQKMYVNCFSPKMPHTFTFPETCTSLFAYYWVACSYCYVALCIMWLERANGGKARASHPQLSLDTSPSAIVLGEWACGGIMNERSDDDAILKVRRGQKLNVCWLARVQRQWMQQKRRDEREMRERCRWRTMLSELLEKVVNKWTKVYQCLRE